MSYQKIAYDNVLKFSTEAMALLAEYDLFPDPYSYEVAYAYVSGENIEITKAIDEYLASEAVLTQEFIEKIYRNIISSESMSVAVDTVANNLTEQMDFASSHLETTENKFVSFDTILEKAIMAIENDSFSKDMVTSLKEETNSLREYIHSLESALEKSHGEIKKLSGYLQTVRQERDIDPLTGLATRKKHDQMVLQLIRSSLEEEIDLAMLFLEVDCFEQFKEKWGHIVSEQILSFTANVMRNNIKGRDFSARYAPYNFSLILPYTDLEGAKALANNIRKEVEAKKIVKKNSGGVIGRVTLSIGVGVYKSGEATGLLTSRVQHALYIAQEKGKNCVVTEAEAEEYIAEQTGKDNKAG